MAGNGVVLWGIGTMRTHRTQWLAQELEIDYELKPIQPRTGETKTPEFLKLNPRHKVPVLTHGDLVLSESAAILNYMTEAFPVPDHFFVPADATARARLAEWCYFTMTELDANSLYTVRRHRDLKDIYGDAPVAVSSAEAYFQHQLDTMAERIRNAGEFLMGDRISVADILFNSCLDWARWYDMPLPDYLMGYQSKMNARPAYRRAYKDNYPGRTVADGR